MEVYSRACLSRWQMTDFQRLELVCQFACGQRNAGYVYVPMRRNLQIQLLAAQLQPGHQSS